MKASSMAAAFVPSSSSWGGMTASSAACCAAAAGAFYLVWSSKRRRQIPLWQMSDDSNDLEESLLLNVNHSSNKDDDTKCIYLDYNGTTPVHRLVVAAMLPYLLTHFGNPSSTHYYGKQPRLAIQQARRSLLQLLGCPDEAQEDSIWFTGCGTESDNLAIHLALQSTPHIMTKKHIVTSNVEHPAIEACLNHLQQQQEKVEVTYVPVDTEGRVAASDMIAAIRPDETVLVTLMLANNESGALQPVQQVAKYCRQHGILIHTDAAQAAGKVSVELKDLGHPDMVSIVGHKLGAPKGVAALYVRPDCLTRHGRQLPPSYGKGGIMLVGGGQEGGRRAGTENVPYIVGLGRAAELARIQLKQNAAHMADMRNRLLRRLTHHLGHDVVVRPNGPSDPNQRLPNTLSVGLKNVHSGQLLANIGNEVAASAGAACHSSGSGDSISSVLKAMQVPPEFAAGTLRLSVGPTTTTDDIDRAANIIAREAKEQVAAAAATAKGGVAQSK